MTPTPTADHIAIRVTSLSISVPWYTRYFSGREMWTLTEFSDLTRSRLPGISTLVEIAAGEVKFHLFEQDETVAGPAGLRAGFQHIGMRVGSLDELEQLRDRWVELSLDPQVVTSGSASELTADATTKTVSFYCTDPDGTEFEIIADGLASDLC
jgi:catechol 2,3-dioxygenase-like lactoylglutathione lyase family enzyme